MFQLNCFLLYFLNVGKSCLDVYKIKCETETNCVSPKQYCNGVRDCEDGVDELYCGKLKNKLLSYCMFVCEYVPVNVRV